MGNVQTLFNEEFINAYLNWIINILKNGAYTFAYLILNMLMILLVYRSREKDVYFGEDIRKAPYFYVGTYDISRHGKINKAAREKGEGIRYSYDLDDSTTSTGVSIPEFFNIQKYTWPYNNINYQTYTSYFLAPILYAFWAYRWMFSYILRGISVPPVDISQSGIFTYQNFLDKILLIFGPVFLILATFMLIAPFSFGYAGYAVIAEQWPNLDLYPPPFPLNMFSVINYVWIIFLYFVQIIVAISSIMTVFMCWMTIIPICILLWYIAPLFSFNRFLKKINEVVERNKRFFLYIIIALVYYSALTPLSDYPNIINGIGIVVLVTILTMLFNY